MSAPTNRLQLIVNTSMKSRKPTGDHRALMKEAIEQEINKVEQRIKVNQLLEDYSLSQKRLSD